MRKIKNDKLRVVSAVSALLLTIPLISSAHAGHVHVDTIAQINSDLYLDTSIDSTLNSTTSSNSTTSVDTDVNAGTATGSETEAEGAAELRLNILGIPVLSSAQVTSDADLEAFTENVNIRSDGDVEVETSAEDEEETKVIVKHKHQGELFGFIPVSVESTTEVRANEDEGMEVDSDLSWWSVLVAKENYNEEELESSIRNNPVIVDNARAGASATAKARIAEVMIGEIEAHTLGQLSVNE